MALAMIALTRSNSNAAQSTDPAAMFACVIFLRSAGRVSSARCALPNSNTTVIIALLTGGTGKLMGISDRHRSDAATAPNLATTRSNALRDLAEARDALARARLNAKWIRKCKTLHRATRDVENAALAARSAGVAWNEIGDVLGIERAMTSDATAVGISA